MHRIWTRWKPSHGDYSDHELDYELYPDDFCNRFQQIWQVMQEVSVKTVHSSFHLEVVRLYNLTLNPYFIQIANRKSESIIWYCDILFVFTHHLKSIASSEWPKLLSEYCRILNTCSQSHCILCWTSAVHIVWTSIAMHRINWNERKTLFLVIYFTDLLT